MAQPAVEAFVRERLRTNWFRCPVIEMNTVGEAPQDGSPYLVTQYPASTTGLADITEQQLFEEGGVRFVLHLPRGEGLARAKEWSQALGDLFRSVQSGGLKFGAPSSPFYDDSNDEGAYFISTVVVPYSYFF